MNQTADSARSAVFSVATERSPRFGRLAVRKSFVHAFEVDITADEQKSVHPQAWRLTQSASVTLDPIRKRDAWPSPRFERLAVRNSFVHAFEVDIEKPD